LPQCEIDGTEALVQPFIEVQGLEHVYPLDGGGQVAALQGVDLTIERGEFVALVGPNGSGKSTLARHFNGLLLPTAGRVWVEVGSRGDAVGVGCSSSRAMAMQVRVSEVLTSRYSEIRK